MNIWWVRFTCINKAFWIWGTSRMSPFAICFISCLTGTSCLFLFIRPYWSKQSRSRHFTFLIWSRGIRFGVLCDCRVCPKSPTRMIFVWGYIIRFLRSGLWPESWLNWKTYTLTIAEIDNEQTENPNDIQIISNRRYIKRSRACTSLYNIEMLMNSVMEATTVMIHIFRSSFLMIFQSAVWSMYWPAMTKEVM